MALSGCPVLFVMAPGGATRYFPEHLGTAFLRTVLRRAGIDSSQYLPQRNPSLSGFAGFLDETRPRVVGFTVYESNIRVSRSLIRAARETLPDSVIVVGGPNATFTPEETLRLLGADVCLRGAGEGTIVSLVQRILGSDSASRRLPDLLRDVPNLVLRARDGNFYTPSEDLSSFPAKYFATLDDIPSPFQNGVVSSPDIGYLSARGCNQHCTFCSFAALSGRRVAFHSVERVLDDLAALEALASRVSARESDILIYDDAFTFSPERARRICEGIVQKGIRLSFRCTTRGDRVTPDLLRLMRHAGFVSISFGLESAVPGVLRTIGKVGAPDRDGDPHFEQEKHYLERFRWSVESAQRCGLEVDISVIGGLPGETAEDFRKTLEFVASLEVGFYAHNVLSVLPGTPLHDRRRGFGLDAFREPRTAIWRTVHPYAVTEVRPLSNSHTHRSRWNAGKTLSDALCGRGGVAEADDHSVWAVVVHEHPRSRKLAAWLRRILAISGFVIVVDRSRSAAARWRAFLTNSRVPFGDLCVLLPTARDEGMSFDAQSWIGEHRFQVLSRCSPDMASVPVEVDEDSNCRVSIWIASAPGARIGFQPGWDCPVVGPGLQIADSCRLGNVPPRCHRPRVLHVDSEGRLRACWDGPVIGVVGDDLVEVSTRGRSIPPLQSVSDDSLGKLARCPLGPLRGMEDETPRLRDLDLASQLSWLFRVGRNAGQPVEA